MKYFAASFFITAFVLLVFGTAEAQIGKRFPSEKKIVKDPVTGTMLTFLTSTPAGDSKIYQTHNQWTSDGQWVIFRSNRVRGEAMAVNEKTGDIVQVTEGGYTGMLNVARRSMKLFFLRNPPANSPRGSMQVVEVDLGKLFADSAAGTLKPAEAYQRICGTTPSELGAGGDMALDGDENWVYFRVGRNECPDWSYKILRFRTVSDRTYSNKPVGAGRDRLLLGNRWKSAATHLDRSFRRQRS